MHTEPRSRTASIAVSAEAAAHPRPTGSGPDPALARPLGPKAAALHLRRLRAAALHAVKPTADDHTDRDGPWRLHSEDGALSLCLQCRPHGVYLERTQRRPLDALLVQAMVFENRAEFLAWCESDPVRFDHPLLYLRLRRLGHELFDRRP